MLSLVVSCVYFCLSDFCYIYGLLYFSSSIFDACDCWPMLLLVLSLFCLIVNSRTLNLHIFAVLVFLFFFIVFFKFPCKNMAITWVICLSNWSVVIYLLFRLASMQHLREECILYVLHLYVFLVQRVHQRCRHLMCER